MSATEHRAGPATTPASADPEREDRAGRSSGRLRERGAPRLGAAGAAGARTRGALARRVPTARLSLLLAAAAALVLGEGTLLPPPARAPAMALTLAAALLAALGDAAATPRPGELEVARVVRGPLCFGRPARVEVAFRWRPPRTAAGPGRRLWWADLPPAGTVEAAPQGVGRLAAGVPLTAAYEVLPRARGTVRWEGPRLSLEAPLGLWALAVSVISPEEHTVYPGGLPGGMLPGRREQAGAPAAGDWGVEPDGVRAYLPGEDARRIAWRASARRDEPVVPRLRPERGQRVLLVVDAGRWSSVAAAARPVPATRLDVFCAAALRVAAAALAAGDAVGAALVGETGAAVLGPRGGGDTLARLAGLLALATPGERDVDWARATAAVRGVGADIVVCFAEAPSPQEAPELLRYLPRLGRLTRVAYCGLCPAEVRALAAGDPAGEEDEMGAALRLAAAETLAGRRAAVRALARAGVAASDTVGDTLGPEAVALYRRLSARGRAL